MRNLWLWLPTSPRLPFNAGGTRMLMLLGATSAKRPTDSPDARLSVSPVGIRSGRIMYAPQSDAAAAGRGIDLVKSAVLLMTLLLPAPSLATDWAKSFLPPVRNGLGPVEVGCTISGPSLQSHGGMTACGHRFNQARIVTLMCPSQRRAWDVHLWASYLVYDTTPGGIRYVTAKRIWKRWYSRCWSQKAAYKDCQRFRRAWRKHLKARRSP